MELKTNLAKENTSTTNIRKLDSGEVSRRIDTIGQNLDIPKDQLDRARNTEVLIVDRNTFFKKVEKHFLKLGFEIPRELTVDEDGDEKKESVFKAMGTSIEEVSKRRRDNLKKFFDEYSSLPGISYYEDGLSTVMINSDEISSDEEMEMALTHELLHSIANSSELESGFGSEGSFHFLKEAVVQLMVVRINNSNLEWPDFIDKYLNGEIHNRHYDSQMKVLLAIVKATSFGKGGLYGFDEISKMYFSDEGNSDIKGIMFKLDLFGRIPEKLGENLGFRDKLLEIFEDRLEGDSIYNQKRQLETNPTALKAK